MRTRICLVAFLCLVSAPCVFSQYPGTGVYAFGSYDNKGFDSINLGNLNVHFAIPIVAKNGRGLPFTYTLVYDGLVWSSVTSTGTGYWQPDPNWGFYGQLGQEGFRGYVSYSEYQQKCFIDPPSWFWADHQTNYIYHDQFGVSHSLNYSYNACTDGDPQSGDGSTSDGSGIRFDGEIYFRNGSRASVPINTVNGSGNVIDTNGNTITNNGDGTFVDTTGTTELTIAGAGNASSPLTFKYPVLQSGNLTTATVTVHYSPYTVQTYFNCSNISEYSATSISLVDSITLPDSPSDTYTFSYEQTPQGPGVVSGAVTGRLASITLPSGGTISYTYSGGCSGGINTDGTPATLTRSTSDGQNTYTKTYTRNISSAPVSTTVAVDEKGNETDFNFISDTNGNTFETSRGVYQGAASGGNQLESKTTTYNSLPPSTQIAPPITQTSTSDQYNGLKPVLTVTNYQSGLPTSSTIEDPSNGNAILVASTTSYNSYGEVTSSQTTDPQNNVVTSATYGYDETTPTATSGIPQHNSISGTPGNQTSAHISTGNGTLDSSTAYYDTGMPVSTTAPGSFTTTYGYNSTQAFATQTTLPTPSSGVQIAASASYDAASGVQTSATGPNNGQTFTALYDSLFRPTQVTTPEGGQTTYSYTPTQVSTITKMSSTQSSDQETFLDGYGRTKRVAVANGTGWYLTDACYDAAGLLQYQSTPYYSSAENPGSMACSSSTARQYSYDALGRKTQINNPDGSSVNLTYYARAVESSTSTGVSRITQYDLLGRISTVCEISSNSTMPGSGTPQSCGADIGGTGFLTSYAYNLSVHTTTVTQGAQTRIFQTDAAGRTVYMLEPEAGATNYSYAYNGTGLVVTRTRPKANQTNPATLTTSTTQYDSLGRILTVTYSDGTPQKYFAYDVASPGNYAVGQMNVAVTFPPGQGVQAQRDYGYDIMGRVNGTDECTPDGCGNSAYDVGRSYSYDLASNMASETYDSVGGGKSPITLNYGYNLAGQLVSVSGGQNNGALSPSIYSVQAIGPSGPTLAQYGNGLYGITGHDIENRINLLKICGGSTDNSYNETCSGGSLYYWTILNTVGNQVKSMADSTVGEGSTENYDEFGRLTSQNYQYGWMNTSISYVYDRYGNRWQQNITQGSGPQPQLSFNASNNQVVGYQYDAAGNVINDGVHTYTYDAENNLIGIDNGATATFVYDALNERVKVSTSAGAQDYGYDLSGRRSTVWLPGSTSMNAVQYYAGSNRVAYWTASDGNIHFEHQDWLGTERMRTSATASVDGSYSSLPFGDNLQVSGSDTNAGHFAMLDQDLSSSSGLSHAMFREYSETAGRWMSPDPYSGSYQTGNPQSLNRYSYVHNQPLSKTDVLGLDPTCLSPDGEDWGCISDGEGQPPSDPNNPGDCDPNDPNCVSVSANNTCDDYDVCITNPTAPETQAPSINQTGTGPTGTAPNRNPAPNKPPTPQPPTKKPVSVYCTKNGCYPNPPAPSCSSLDTQSYYLGNISTLSGLVAFYPPAAIPAGGVSAVTGLQAMYDGFLSRHHQCQ